MPSNPLYQMDLKFYSPLTLEIQVLIIEIVFNEWTFDFREGKEKCSFFSHHNIVEKK